MYVYCMQNQTTIRISVELLKALKEFKEDNESYEEVIWDFIEPHLELSTESKGEIEKSLEEYKRGEFSTIEEVKKELGF